MRRIGRRSNTSAVAAVAALLLVLSGVRPARALDVFTLWRQPQVPPQALVGEGQAYWQDFLDYPTFVAIEAFAPGAAPQS